MDVPRFNSYRFEPLNARIPSEKKPWYSLAGLGIPC